MWNLKFIKKILTSLISVLSSHLRTSAPSSPSALKQARRAINTAAASWSNPADMWWILVEASAQLQVNSKFKKKDKFNVVVIKNIYNTINILKHTVCFY